MTGPAASRLLSTAQRLGDEPIIKFAADILASRKEEARKRKRARSHQYERAILHDTTDEWTGPQNTEYTAYQLRIANDDVPTEEILTQDIVKTYQKAVARGETEIANRLKQTIDARHEKQRTKMKADRRKSARKASTKKNKRWRAAYPNNYLPASNPYRTELSERDYRILDGTIGLFGVSLRDLQYIRLLCENSGNQNLVELADRQIYYKEHPNAVFITHDREEALDIIEKLLGIRITRYRKSRKPLKREQNEV